MRHILKSFSRFQRARVLLTVVLVVFGALMCSHALPVYAQSQGDFGVAAVDSQISLSGTSIVVIIVRVIRILLGFLGLVLVILIMYAGYTIMTSGGNEEKITKGKTILRNAVIGTAIILFSLIIVQFVLNILGDVTGARPGQSTPPGQVTFEGIGSLGTVIKDHYPYPDQTNVYRNTKIVITFTESIDPASIVENTNGSCWSLETDTSVAPNADKSNCRTSENGDPLEYFGDCVNGVCDSLRPSAITVRRLTTQNGSADGDLIPLSALVAYEQGTEAHTFVFKLKENKLFGNGETDQWHKVIVSDTVRNTSGDSVFAGQVRNSYEWQFETNTEVDLSPPYVVGVSPNPGDVVEKNRILKLTFNEAVDPMTVQGMLSASSSFSNVIVDMVGNNGVRGVASTPASGGEADYAPEFLETRVETGNRTVADVLYSGGEYMYVAYTDGTVAKINVQFPADPSVSDTMFVLPPYGVNGPRYARDMALNGSLLYIVSHDVKGDGGGMLSIVNATTMQEIVNFSGDDLQNARSIAVIGTSAYVADDEGIKVFDVSNPSAPVDRGALGSAFNSGEYVLLTDGTDLYYVHTQSYKFGIVNLSSGGASGATVLRDVGLGSPYTNSAFFVRDGVAYIGTNSGMKVIDMTADLLVVSTLSVLDSHIFASNGAIVSIASRGDIFVVGQTRAVNVFTLKNGVLEFLYTASESNGAQVTEDLVRPLAILSGYVYVGDKNNGIKILRLLRVNAGRALTNGEPGVQVTGQWKITNGYRSIEFLSSELCGDNAVNSCGDPLYCLPTGCASYDTQCTADYVVLARTASLLDPAGDSFESAGLFDGVVDMADNALDSAPDGIDTVTQSMNPGAHDLSIYEAYAADPSNPWRHRPPVVKRRTVDPEEMHPDNYWWHFTVQNKIDSTVPYVETVDPGIDQNQVTAQKQVDIQFSKDMWVDTLSAVRIIEYPASAIGVPVRHETDDVQGSVFFGEAEKQVTKTKLHVLHPGREFGIGGIDVWYFLKMPSTIKASNQFCFYPGLGPDSDAPDQGVSDPCSVAYTDEGDVVQGGVNGCVPVTTASSTDTGCVYIGGSADSHTVADIDTCIQNLSTDAVSPTSQTAG